MQSPATQCAPEPAYAKLPCARLKTTWDGLARALRRWLGNLRSTIRQREREWQRQSSESPHQPSQARRQVRVQTPQQHAKHHAAVRVS